MKGKYTTKFLHALQVVAMNLLIMNDELDKGRPSTIMVGLTNTAIISVADMIDQLEKEAGE